MSSQCQAIGLLFAVKRDDFFCSRALCLVQACKSIAEEATTRKYGDQSGARDFQLHNKGGV